MENQSNISNLVDRDVDDGVSFKEKVGILSQGSVRRHFDAFIDIDWDAPENAVRTDDERWILSDADVLGSHPWYKSLSKDEQIRVGMEMFGNLAKTGSEFEMPLIAGIMAFNMRLKNGDPVFRYAMHEATEETHHIQMFQESVNRLGAKSEGPARWFRATVPPLATVAGRYMPAVLWTAVLAGEEPIDHVQKKYLRENGDNMHPLARQVMATHIAEEARHIGFAHEYLKEHIPKLSTANRLAIAAIYPVAMRVLADVIMRPSKETLAAIGIPREVADDVWWGREASKDYLKDLFPDTRMLAEDLEIKNTRDKKSLVGTVGSIAWRACGIDGRASRYRNEPNRMHQYAAA